MITEIQITKDDSTYRHLFLYGQDKNKTLETKYVYKNDEWRRREQTEWTYNNNHCAYQYIRKWINSQWVLVNQINYTYLNDRLSSETLLDFENDIYFPVKKHSRSYINQKISEETDSSWVNSTWIISSKTKYIYNSDSQNTDTIYFTKFIQGNTDLQSRISFVYNSSAQIYQQTYSEKQNEDWQDVLQTSTYYDPVSNNKVYQITKEWDSMNHQLENTECISYTYDETGNLKSGTYREWKSQFWKNTLRYEYYYNTDNVLTKKIVYQPIYEDFRPVSSINYSDFKYGKASLVEAKYEFWGGTTGDLTNTFIPFLFNDESQIQYGKRIKINYIPVDETGITTLSDYTGKGEIQIYPNPSDGIFYFDVQKYNVNGWIVSDISGKTILSKSNTNNSGVIDLGDYKSGIYLLQVKTENGILTQKLIKR
ncbi:MAG: T9SS type A sorting domain-containing protein [Paludibacteraceae bacterium]